MKTQTITIIGLNCAGALIGLALKQSLLAVTIIGSGEWTRRGSG